MRRQPVALKRGFRQESEQNTGVARLEENVTARLLADHRQALRYLDASALSPPSF
jgi:hypothetical protein